MKKSCRWGIFGVLIFLFLGACSPTSSDEKSSDASERIPETQQGCQEGAKRSCFSGAGHQEGIGVCKAGQQICENNQWKACDGEILPSLEVCDGLDNNCDGKIDEGFTDLGQTCTVGVGECKDTGKKVCSQDKSKTECNVKGKSSVAEICDGLDNDCNGKIDESFTDLGKECVVGLGECKNKGKYVCSSDKTKVECNAKPKASITEVCDGKDNNCDGQIDESFTALGKTCTVGVGECVNTGKNVCSADQSKTECNAKPKASTPEVCDGKDNNCDGQIDEAFTALGKACTVGVGECVNTGKNVCSTDQSKTECNAKPKASVKEICDGKDNDCNGKIDETFGDLGKECTVGIGQCQNTGKKVCSADKSKTECSVQPKASAKEICDGLDNDCDGKLDPSSCDLLKNKILTGHKNKINSIAIHPNKLFITSASFGSNDTASPDNERIKIWDATTGKELDSLTEHTNIVFSVAYRPSGTHLASASADSKILLWDTTTQKIVQTFVGHTGLVYSVAFSSDGSKLVSGDSDYQVKLWDVSTAKEISTLTGHQSFVYGVAFSPDGKKIASASFDHTVKIWDVSTSSVLQTLTKHTGPAISVTFSPDGKILASTSEDKTIRLWDTTTWKVLQTLSGHTNTVVSASFNPDGKTIASSSLDKTIGIWSVAHGTLLQTIAGHTDSVTKVVWKDANSLFSSSFDKTIILWTR